VIDQRRLHNWLEQFGFEHVGFERSGGLHASGHASGIDLLGIVRGIAPRTLVPIHSKTPELYAEHVAGTGIQVIVPQAGVPILAQHWHNGCSALSEPIQPERASVFTQGKEGRCKWA